MFSKEKYVTTIANKFSQFIQYPLKINNSQVNTLQPIWSKDKDVVTLKEHNDFFEYLSNNKTSFM